MVGEIRIENVSKSFLNADGTVLNALNEVNLSVYKMSRPNVQKILYKNVQLVCLF